MNFIDDDEYLDDEFETINEMLFDNDMTEEDYIDYLAGVKNDFIYKNT